MPPALHVLFVVNPFPPRVGGVEQHVSSLARELVAQGHRVSVATLTQAGAGRAKEDGVTVRRFPGRVDVGGVVSFPRPGLTRTLVNWGRMAQVSAVSVHTRFFPMSWVGLRVATRLSVPCIHTEHGSNHVASGNPVIDLASRVYDESIGRQVLRQATVCLGVSREAARFAERLGGRKAEVFHNAIDVGRFAAARPGSGGKRLVFLARLVSGKGWRVAFDVAGQLRAELGDVTLDVVGDGSDRRQVEAAARGAEWIRVHGRVDPAAVPALLAGAVLLNPSTLSEGFQTTLLEALAAGGQVVTYPVAGAADLARRGPQICIVPPDADELLAAARVLLAEQAAGPMPLQNLDDWDWRRQARRFAAIVAAAQSRVALDPAAGANK